MLLLRLLFLSLLPALLHTQEAISTNPALLLPSQASSFRPFLATYESSVERPFKKVLKQEINAIATQQQRLTTRDRARIQYWHSGAPAFRWQQIISRLGDVYPHRKNGGRMANLHLAIYDATVAAWQQKAQFTLQAPYQASKTIQALSPAENHSAFVCERAAVAGAAATIITYYFPEAEAEIHALLADFRLARMASGLQYPSQVAAGIAIGRSIAQTYIQRAKTDRTQALWEGQAPIGPGLWTGIPSKKDPMKGQWKPFVLRTNDQFRPAPPPIDFSADMEELRQFNRQHRLSDIAWKWKSQPIFDELLDKQIFIYSWDEHPLLAAFAAALFHTTRYEATIVAWEAKYTYWTIRPFQLDPSFRPFLVDTPNFPGYPAGHTTVAAALETALSFLFPQDQASFQQLALECAESRFEGGVHFRIDNEVGLQTGSQVGAYVVQHFQQLFY